MDCSYINIETSVTSAWLYQSTYTKLLQMQIMICTFILIVQLCKVIGNYCEIICMQALAPHVKIVACDRDSSGDFLLWVTRNQWFRWLVNTGDMVVSWLHLPKVILKHLILGTPPPFLLFFFMVEIFIGTCKWSKSNVRPKMYRVQISQ